MNRQGNRAKPLVKALFSARSIAVVGASDKPGSVGHDVISNLRRKGFTGRILPVNPRRDEVCGLACYPSLEAVPGPVDLVAVAVPAQAVPEVIHAAGALGASSAIVFASGFSEAGEDGSRLQAELVTAAEAWGMRLIGPNCQGFMNVSEGVHVGFGPAYKLDYTPGNVSIMSQSGAFGNSLLMGMDAEGVGTRFYISTGNEAETGAMSVIDAFLDDPQTHAVAGYLEGVRSPSRLRGVAAKARERGVPLVFWKVGSSDAGAKAAASHTASLAGNDRLLRSAFRQFGIVEAHDIGDMADCVRALEPRRRARGNRIGVVTISGGAGVAMADRASDFGLSLPELSPETIASLRKYLPAFASIANPLDVTAGATADAEGFIRALDAVIADPGVDMLALCFAAASGKAAMAIADAVERAAADHDLPIVVAWNAPEGLNQAAFDRVHAAGVPIYASPARAIRGLAAVWQATRPREIPAAPALLPSGDTRMLNEADSKRYLSGTGIEAPDEAIAMDARQAKAAAEKIGFPVVMKLVSSQLAHKSDIGGVRVGVKTAQDAVAGFEELSAIPARLHPPVPFEGVLVQRQITGGVEVILGARRDPDFGPMVMVGAGGVLAELLDDVALRLAPISPQEAREMIAETRLPKLLAGWRGAPPADSEALIAATAALSQRIADPDCDLSEIEINPLFVLPEGDGLMAGDCVAHAGRGAGEM